jgi:hypothetical protein
MTTFRTRRLAQLAALAGTLGALGACTSVHPRVWQNGAAMSSSAAYTSMVHGGDRSIATQRKLYSSATPLRFWYSDRPYQPFTRW